MIVLIVVVAVLVVAVTVLWWHLWSRNMQIWIGAYLRQSLRPRHRPHGQTTHVYFCLADHYEPYWGKVDAAQAQARVRRWVEQYPTAASRHYDSESRPPQHSFFYPEEEYDPLILQWLAELCREGFGDVEVHLHHDNDTAENLRGTLLRYKELLFTEHGLLRRDSITKEIVYCFIHGNWALDNSRPDGRWCGVDDELSVLVDTGCRCDMTMPSAPSDTQTRKINSIYFARGRPGQRKSHEQGRDASCGQWAEPGELLLVQGPLTLNWRERKLALIPRIESGEISVDAPPTRERALLWVNCAIKVHGAEDYVFVKLHTHGADERTTEMLFDNGFERLWGSLEELYRDRPGYALHYVTAWEMYRKVEELSRGRGQTL